MYKLLKLETSDTMWKRARMASHVHLLLSIIWILAYFSRATNGDVFASSAQLRMLDEGEVDLIDAVKSYIDRERQKLDELDRLVVEVEEERRVIETKSPLISSIDHPVYVFRLIHRFTTTWNREILPLINDSTAIDGVRDTVNSLDEIMPTDDDYAGAKLALIRLQRAYELNISDVINGTILEQTTQPMTQQMVVDVAMLALDRKLADDAILWLTHAQNHPVPPMTSFQDIYHAMSRVHAQKGEFLKAVDLAKMALEIDPSNADYLSNILPSDDSQTIDNDWMIFHENHKSLCRQHLVQSNSPIDSTLSCFYERGRHTPMLRTKIEMLHQSPDVVIYHDFVTDNEAAELRRIAMPEIERARVGNSLRSLISEVRLGKVAFIDDNTGEPLVDRISKRISEATGLETKHPFAESIQLSNYGLGGHYNTHYDHDTARYKRTEQPIAVIQAGDRIATFMIYLNDVEAGGATVFPYLNIGTRPVKNAAVFWYNLKRSGFSEPLSLHAGCPVLIGEKWVANKWIREFGQVFRRPCDLSSDI